ncbi:MAG: helix-turn-helix domain-containing protein [Devosiaceae bacterium]
MKPDETDEIRRLNLFSGMADEHFESLFRGAYVQNFPPMIELIAEGDPADFLHVVLDGSVELFAAWNDRETTMATVQPISTFILAATIKDAPYLMSARTLEKSRIVLLPSMDVRDAFDQDPAFARSMVRELAQCYRSVIKNSKNLKLRTSIERLANYLLRKHAFGDGSNIVELSMEKRRLASFLGMTPENLSRAFKTLQGYGVEVDGSKVTIHDLDDLTAFAKPEILIDDYTV